MVTSTTSTGWIGTKFGPDIHGTQRPNPTDIGDPLTLCLAPP